MHPFSMIASILPMRKVMDIMYNPQFDTNLALYRDVYGQHWVGEKSWLGYKEPVAIRPEDYSDVRECTEPFRAWTRLKILETLISKAA